MPEAKKKAENTVPQFYSPSGDQVRKLYTWKADYSGLEEVGEVDIQEELNEAGLGRSTGEMVRRILAGDTSALQPGEGLYADVSGVPESGIEAAAVALAPKNKLETVAQEKGISVEDLKAVIEGLIAEAEKPVGKSVESKEGE